MTTPWQPGDTTMIRCRLSTHYGSRAELIERKVGEIAGRAYWTLRLAHNGAITTEFEDSLGERAGAADTTTTR